MPKKGIEDMFRLTLRKISQLTFGIRKPTLSLFVLYFPLLSRMHHMDQPSLENIQLMFIILLKFFSPTIAAGSVLYSLQIHNSLSKE